MPPLAAQGTIKANIAKWRFLWCFIIIQFNALRNFRKVEFSQDRFGVNCIILWPLLSCFVLFFWLPAFISTPLLDYQNHLSMLTLFVTSAKTSRPCARYSCTIFTRAVISVPRGRNRSASRPTPAPSATTIS